MSALVKDKQFYDALESTASTRFTETGLTFLQKGRSGLSPDNTFKNKAQQQQQQIQQEENDEEFIQNFKEHYDVAENALMEGKKVSRDCKVAENDLEYELNVLRIKTQQDLNEIEFSLRPTFEKTWQRLSVQQNNFIAQNADSFKNCKLLECDFQEIQIGFQQLVERMKELERKTGNWIMFKGKKGDESNFTNNMSKSNIQSPKKN